MCEKNLEGFVDGKLCEEVKVDCEQKAVESGNSDRGLFPFPHRTRTVRLLCTGVCSLLQEVEHAATPFNKSSEVKYDLKKVSSSLLSDNPLSTWFAVELTKREKNRWRIEAGCALKGDKAGLNMVSLSMAAPRHLGLVSNCGGGLGLVG